MNVILFSGGLDSAVLSARFLEQNPKEKAILFTLVNSRKNAMEVSHASNLFDKFKAKYKDRVDHRMKMVNIMDESPDYSPFRNSLYVLSAANYFNAETLNIYIGLIYARNPIKDTSQEWLDKLNELIRLENRGATVHAPFLDKDKEDVFFLGKKYGVALADTYSCNYGIGKECGECEDCKARSLFSPI